MPRSLRTAHSVRGRRTRTHRLCRGAVDLLLQTHELRLLAAECRVTSVEVTEGKVKLMQRGTLVTVGGQFPRLSKRDPKGRIQEIRRLLLSLSGDSTKA